MANTMTAFIPEYYSKKMATVFENNAVFPQLCNRDYEGELRNAGDTVKVRNRDTITISNYTRQTAQTSQDLTPGTEDITIDVQKGWRFEMDDLDTIQSDIDTIALHIESAAISMALTVDQHCHSVIYQGVDSSNVIGTSASPITLTADNVYDYIVEMRKKMRNANAKMMGASLVVNPAVEALLLSSPQFTHATSKGDDVIMNASIGKVAGFQVYCSTNLNTVTGYTPIVAVTPQLCTFVSQKDAKPEKFRHPSYPADVVRGNALYKAHVLGEHDGQGSVLWIANS